MKQINALFLDNKVCNLTFKLLLVTMVLMLLTSLAAAEVPVEEPTVDLTIKAAYDNENIYFLFEFESEDMAYPGIFHDYYRYENGEWVRDGYSEDRMTMLMGDHHVNSFDTLGCYVACHDDFRFMPDAPSSDEVSDHEYFGGVLGASDIRKYIPESRGEEVTWDNVVSQEELDQLREENVFLDLIHWRAHRSNPIGYSDSQYVLEYRHSDTGQSPYYTNWDDENEQPAYMFNSDITGFAALSWSSIENKEIGINDYYYLSEDIAVPFDPEHEWEDGDTIPRRILTEPTESRGQITADGTWEDGLWTVELVRKLDTGYALEDVKFEEGEIYYIAPAVHIGDTSGRDHYVTWGYSLGIGTEADIEAVSFTGTPDWNEVPSTTITLFYPSVVSYDFLLDEESHTLGGAACTRAGGTSSPHSPEVMGQFGLDLERSFTEPVDVEPEPEPEPESIPGFGVLFALFGLVATTIYLYKRSK
ncbi:ethylbenzene dehydrogenase-related protein [Methanosalsum natronophilum]|uniref:ethylbenzene dehydrogenase-related protein n=1 Tax=Methanosalsum natronophilum TaxID=768733 RepID=UPI00216A1DE1|nr:ethylbenzene dehydrogenase-related protein [Methanosalsum natronophilum]MCS3923735.1 hypothetical protein [Methanosalsum natronophilum]